MDIGKFEPGRALRTLRDEIDTLFDRFVERPIGAVMGQVRPTLDLSETDTELVVKADLPGLEEKDLDVSISTDMLTIRGEKKQPHEEAGKTYHVAERSSGSFTRSIRLPVAVNADQVRASYKNGVLEIVMPKKEQAQTKRIEIRTE